MIKMITKGRSPAMRHASRTHRVALDWLFDRINLDTKIQIKYIDTKNQLADTLTKGNFTRDEWNQPFQFMSKRTQEDAGEERVTFGITTQREGSERACLDCIGKPGENQV